MTIGPAPMIRIEEMSVRFGMAYRQKSVGSGTKKGVVSSAACRRPRPRPKAVAAGRGLSHNPRRWKSAVRRNGDAMHSLKWTSGLRHARAWKVWRPDLDLNQALRPCKVSA